MNRSSPPPARSSSASAPSTANSALPTAHAPLQPATPASASTPQQVAAAAAALAASRAASVSAAMRSVFGAKQQAALASAMMNAAAVAAANSKVKPPLQQQPLALAKPLAAGSVATSPATPTAAAAAARNATSSVVVMPNSFDGLPALPSHAASCALDDVTARIDAHDVPEDGAVTLFGEPSTRLDVRVSLVRHYASTNQLSDVGGAVTEMTLRMDTELEMLRRQCFAERNARWNYHTPDMFAEFAPAMAPTDPVWVSTPYVGPRKQTMLLRKYREQQRHHDKPLDTLASDALLQSLVGTERVRERAWPPKEFVSKSNSKPSRGGGGGGSFQSAGSRTGSGKKKPVGMAGVVDETPVTARICMECRTQSSALWRKRPRLAPNANTDTLGVGVTPMPTIDAVAGAVVVLAAKQAEEEEEEDVCLPCYLKTQRRELFDRKAAEKVRKAKEDSARAAAEARALKKQQQQIQKKIKKLQQQQALHPLHDGALDATDPTVKTENGLYEAGVAVKDEQESSRPSMLRRESVSNGAGDALLLHEATAAAAAAAAMADEKKKRSDKKSKKDKKKKKKKKKKKASDWEDSDSDDDGAASSVILPSPPQRPMDGFVYADRAELVEPLASSDHDRETLVLEPVEPPKRGAKRAASRSSAWSSSSKKRKSSDAFIEVAAAAMAAAVPPTPTPSSSSSSRSSRARGSTASSTPVAAAASVPPTPTAASSASKKKRARPTKKESARERELRALGQYCPVCNMTYEEDDASPFVCCDSCEMWVHAACDQALTPDALARLAEPNEKYVCPLCGGR